MSRQSSAGLGMLIESSKGLGWDKDKESVKNERRAVRARVRNHLAELVKQCNWILK